MSLGSPRRSWLPVTLSGLVAGWLAMLNPYALLLGLSMWIGLRCIHLVLDTSGRWRAVGRDAVAAAIGFAVFELTTLPRVVADIAIVVTLLQLEPPFVEPKAPSEVSFALSVGTITVPFGRTSGWPPITPFPFVFAALQEKPDLVAGWRDAERGDGADMHAVQSVGAPWPETAGY